MDFLIQFQHIKYLDTNLSSVPSDEKQFETYEAGYVRSFSCSKPLTDRLQTSTSPSDGLR